MEIKTSLQDRLEADGDSGPRQLLEIKLNSRLRKNLKLKHLMIVMGRK